MAFKTVSPKELETNMFRNIADEWLLICCNDEENRRENMMTASWGGVGILWNRPVCTLFVRPQRHTHTLLEKQERFSVCVLPNSLHGAHKVCGSQSGRDVDKIAATGLTEIELENVKAIGEAELVFVVKQIYVDCIKKEGVLDPMILNNYPSGDYHTVYVCEIEKVFVKE